MSDIKQKRKTDNLLLTDEAKIVRGLIKGFDGRVSYDSGAGLIEGRFETPADAHKVFGLIGQLLLDAKIRMTDDRTIDIRL